MRRRTWSIDQLALVAEGATARRGRDEVGMGLAETLESLPPLARSEVVAAWAGSESARLRMAIARALRDPFPVLGAVSALEWLSHDHYGEVRLATCEASACRLAESPKRLTAILCRLVDDTHREVRLAAVSGLQKALELNRADEAIVSALSGAADCDDPAVARRAVDALAHAPGWALTQVWETYEELAAHPEEHDDEVVEQLIEDVRYLFSVDPEHAIHVLKAVARSPEKWLRRKAEELLRDLAPDVD